MSPGIEEEEIVADVMPPCEAESNFKDVDDDGLENPPIGGSPTPRLVSFIEAICCYWWRFMLGTSVVVKLMLFSFEMDC